MYGYGYQNSGILKSGGSAAPPAIDADAQAFFDRVTAASGSLNTTEQNAVNTLVVQMKADGIWDSMKAIYPMVGASAAACSQNLKSASFTGSFSSGWTFASTGVKPNGTSATFDTSYNPLTQGLNVNSNHHSFYLRTNNVTLNAVDGGQIDNKWLSAVYFTDKIYIYNPSNTYIITVPSTSSNSLSINTRRSSTDFAFFKNNVKMGTSTTANVQSFASTNLHFASAGGTTFWSPRENAFGSIGDGLNDTQAAQLYTAVQAFQTTLSRQV